jgi:hypothetical protein
MFNIFKKKNSTSYEDKIWISKEAKYKFIFERVAQSITDGNKLLLISFFDKAMKDVTFVFDKMGIKYENAPSLSSFLSSNNSSAVFLAPASLFKNSDIIRNYNEGGKKIEVLIMEHYPLPVKDEELLLGLQGIFKEKSNPSFLVSFDEPLMKLFGADKIKQTMLSLGMKEDEMLSHPMISKAIKNAQQKIESKVQFSSHAVSSEEWFKMYLKEEL